MGSWYEGQFDHNRAHGSGTFHNADGSEYTGQVNDWKAHGQGRKVFAFADGAEKSWYDGQWEHNKQQGQGVLRLADGTELECGCWDDDRATGQVTVRRSGSPVEMRWQWKPRSHQALVPEALRCAEG